MKWTQQYLSYPVFQDAIDIIIDHWIIQWKNLIYKAERKFKRSD